MFTFKTREALHPSSNGRIAVYAILSVADGSTRTHESISLSSSVRLRASSFQKDPWTYRTHRDLRRLGYARSARKYRLYRCHGTDRSDWSGNDGRDRADRSRRR